VDVKLSDLIEQAVEKINAGVPQVTWSQKDILGDEKMSNAEKDLKLHLFAFVAKEQQGFVFKEKRGARGFVFTFSRSGEEINGVNQDAVPASAADEEKINKVETKWSQENPDDADAAWKVLAACKKAHAEGVSADDNEEALEARIVSAIRKVPEHTNAFLADDDLRKGAMDFWLKNDGYDVWFTFWNDVLNEDAGEDKVDLSEAVEAEELEDDRTPSVTDESAVVAEVLGADAAKKVDEVQVPETDNEADEKAEEELATDEEEEKSAEADETEDDEEEPEPETNESHAPTTAEAVAAPSNEEEFNSWQKKNADAVALIDKKFILLSVRALAVKDWSKAREVVESLKDLDATGRAMVRRLVQRSEVGKTFHYWKPEQAIGVLNELWGTEN